MGAGATGDGEGAGEGEGDGELDRTVLFEDVRDRLFSLSTEAARRHLFMSCAAFLDAPLPAWWVRVHCARLLLCCCVGCRLLWLH